MKESDCVGTASDPRGENEPEIIEPTSSRTGDSVDYLVAEINATQPQCTSFNQKWI
jgi:hypothetical protein